METIEHIVQFDVWCNKCVHHDKKEEDAPCDECLENPTNEYSRRPVYFKEKDITKD